MNPIISTDTSLPASLPIVPPSQAKPPRMLLTRDEVAAELGISSDSVKKKHARGKMPKAVNIGYRTKQWRRTDIELWIELGCPAVKAFEAAKELKQQAERDAETRHRRK